VCAGCRFAGRTFVLFSERAGTVSGTALMSFSLGKAVVQT
jgi:hypothetical protein